MKKKLSLLLLVIITTLYGASSRTPKVTAPFSNEVNQFDEVIFNWSRTLSEAFHIIKTKYYVKDLNPQEAIIKAINSFVSLDPHSIFLDPKTYKEMLESTSGEFFGTGIVINPKAADDDFLVIIDVILGGPADKAGVKAADKVIEIDSSSLRGMTTDDATSKLKGPRHSKVTIKVVRDQATEPLTVTIERNVIKDQAPICYYFKDQHCYYMHLGTFTHTAAQQLEQMLKQSQKNKCHGLILDLRNNAGGLLQSAVDIAGLFLEKESLVCVTKDRNNKVLEEYKTKREPLAKSGVLIIILINNFTASAAEILAGCLKIHADQHTSKGHTLIPIILGTRSFGKSSVQEVIPISNDCALKLTIGLYFLPDHKTIQAVGIEPDIERERTFGPPATMTWLNQVYGRESALKNHIKTPAAQPATAEQPKKKESEKTLKERRKEMIMNDSQIHDALLCISLLQLNPQAAQNRTDALNFIKKTLVVPNQLAIEEVQI
jgi:carboxyl-terminal processing protease